MGEDGKGVSFLLCTHSTGCSCKPAEKNCACRDRHMDTKAKSKPSAKRIIHAGAAKSDVETDSKSSESKIIDPGASRGDAPSGAKGPATT